MPLTGAQRGRAQCGECVARGRLGGFSREEARFSRFSGPDGYLTVAKCRTIQTHLCVPTLPLQTTIDGGGSRGFMRRANVVAANPTSYPAPFTEPRWSFWEYLWRCARGCRLPKWAQRVVPVVGTMALEMFDVVTDINSYLTVIRVSERLSDLFKQIYLALVLVEAIVSAVALTWQGSFVYALCRDQMHNVGEKVVDEIGEDAVYVNGLRARLRVAMLLAAFEDVPSVIMNGCAAARLSFPTANPPPPYPLGASAPRQGHWSRGDSRRHAPCSWQFRSRPVGHERVPVPNLAGAPLLRGVTPVPWLQARCVPDLLFLPEGAQGVGNEARLDRHSAEEF